MFKVRCYGFEGYPLQTVVKGFILLLFQTVVLLGQMLVAMVLSQNRVSSSKTVGFCSPSSARSMGQVVTT